MECRTDLERSSGWKLGIVNVKKENTGDFRMKEKEG